MPTALFNGVKLYYEEAGSGQPLILVHGSWTDHHSWDLVAPYLLPAHPEPSASADESKDRQRTSYT